MTQDEMISMAREAGLQHIPIDLDYPVIGKAIERFAALVAAHERERCIAAIRKAHDEELCDAWDCIDVIKGLE